MALKIFEIFHSLQGETSRIGLPTVFVRLTGCPMRCTYCDTAYAFSGGGNMEIANIMQKVAEFGTQYVTVTGGEPLAQKECYTLLQTLCDAGYSVSLETGGAIESVLNSVAKAANSSTVSPLTASALRNPALI